MNNLNTAIINNRRNSTKPVALSLYGNTDIVKPEFKRMRTALYNWAVADRDGTVTPEHVNEAFTASKAVMAYYRDDGVKIVFKGVEDLANLRDGVIVWKNKPTQRMNDLCDTLNILNGKLNVAEYVVRLAVTPEDTEKCKNDIASLKSEIADVEQSISDLKECKQHNHKVMAEASDDLFRYTVELFVADRLESIVNKTEAELEAERKVRTALRRKQRNAQRKREKELEAAVKAQESQTVAA